MSDNFHPHEIFKFCPKCGKETLYVLNPKAQSCHNCNFLFYTNAAAACAAIIINSKNEILLTRRAFEPNIGMFDLPGGFIDPMESAEEALLREVKEELNIDITKYKYYTTLPNRYVYKGILYYTLDMFFICEVSNFDKMVAADDVQSFEFVDLKTISFDTIGLDSIRKILKKYCSEFL